MRPNIGISGEAKRHDASLLRKLTPQRQITVGRDQIHAQLQLFGVHNAANAAAAAAAALAMGVDADCIQRGLEATSPVEGRLRLFANSRGTRVIDDTYNANPHSLRAALAVLAERKGTRWLVLGDMAELGPDADDFHAQAGIQARAAGVHRLFAVGDLSRRSVDAFGEGAQHYPDRDALCEALNESLAGDETVLVKGSRSMAMDTVVQTMLKEASPCC